MPIVNHYYNQLTKKYIALFGSLFNEMVITRDDNSGEEQQRMYVPISYGPYQKFLSRIQQDPDLDRPQAVSLPRMAFEIESMSYDPQRKTNSLNRIRDNSSTETKFFWSPAPYNLEINLYIMTSYAEDGAKILEQILPFFKPEYTFLAKIMDDMPPLDLPLVLNSTSAEDIYEADYSTRRSLMWTLSFTLKGWFFGPEREPKLVKFADVNFYDEVDESKEHSERVVVKPGLTRDGTPTSKDSESVHHLEIEEDDDWGVITLIETNEE